MEIIALVEGTELPVRATLRQLAIPKSTFYDWYQRFLTAGFDGLHDKKPTKTAGWNRIPKAIKDEVLDLALERTDLSPRELACRFTDEKRYFVSESSVYRILKAADLITSPAYVLMSASDAFQNPTSRVHEMWQTDFTYFRIINWGWYYLSTVLDDFSRYIIAWKLSSTMGATDVLDQAISVTGVDYHRTMKNVVKLEHYYFPWQLKDALRDFIAYYNNERHHESLDNVTPSDVYFGRKYKIITEREKIKKRTMRNRKKGYLASKAA